MHGLPESERAKIALFTNVAIPDVISLPDAKTIYEIPLLLRHEGLGERVVNKLSLPVQRSGFISMATSGSCSKTS